MIMNLSREGLMTYKQFMQVLEDDISPSEAERRYQEYRTEYITTQKRAYFDLHKNEDWLKDKYHPTNLSSVIERRNERCKVMAKDFFLDLQNGSLDLGPGITAGAAGKPGSGGDGNSDDDMDGDKRRKHGKDSSKGTDSLSGAPKAHPVSSESRRIQADIEQTLALVRKLDAEKGIESNVLLSGDHDKPDVDKSHIGSMGPIIIIRGLTTVKGLEGVELLDTILTYLWRIHGVDYYGTSESHEAKGLRHQNSTHIEVSIWGSTFLIHDATSDLQDRGRRRPGMDNRLRSDRGNNRDNDKAERDGRYGRGDRSPSRDGPDDQMFDAFRGRGSNAPFVAEFPPPPILMPVPGAGPLGPFVPAPPEIAMHMMREQGPPPPFEPNGAPHGNTGMLGPMMGGPAPIITMPPNFRHDPRRLRRFTQNSRISVSSCLVAQMCIVLCCCCEGKVFFQATAC
ncbi:Serrate RNA effector molecule [Dichanthelium oligosanthes]|uniref:Serrate RNA effector molecule n=1 Tax=Dichanthelium oligosanthes TaxID=888268 RepID=A0A1E5WJ76_9POAL|nr:Serrate RNA effector molecule [Dichanthelium oligosanthes]